LRSRESPELDRREAPPAPSLEARELEERLWEEVARLPEETREALFLYYYDGLSTREVARTQGVSLSTVKNRLDRGRKALREKSWRRLKELLLEEAPSKEGLEAEGAPHRPPRPHVVPRAAPWGRRRGGASSGHRSGRPAKPLHPELHFRSHPHAFEESRPGPAEAAAAVTAGRVAEVVVEVGRDSPSFEAHAED
jgi:predicted DNA-binding protein (UPF0251 family)